VGCCAGTGADRNEVHRVGCELHGSSSELDADEEVVRMDRVDLPPPAQTKFQEKGGGELTRDGPLPLVELSKLLPEEPVKIDQTIKIDSFDRPSRAARDRPELMSVAVRQQLPEDTGPAGETASRPCLAVLPGGAQSDVELMRCFRTGDWGGFAALYDRYFITAYVVCRRSLACSKTALDSASDTFLALIAESDHLDPYRLSDWLVDTAQYLADRRAHHGPQPSGNGSRMQLVQCYAGTDSRTGEPL
jgi:hypothetical protein